MDRTGPLFVGKLSCKYRRYWFRNKRCNPWQIRGYRDKVEYKVRTNQNWETIFVEIVSHHDNKKHHVILESDGCGNWIMNNKKAQQLAGCIDIDVSLTPFTNSLPINRLKLDLEEEQKIKVIYCNLLAPEILPVEQIYRRLSETEYQFENVTNDFQAKIEVDELGLIVNYPSLFVRTARIFTNYH